MKITVKGNINVTYVQTLCLIFFPGSKFPEDEAESPDIPHVKIDLSDRDGGAFCHAEILLSGKIYAGEYAEPYRENGEMSDGRVRKIAVGRAFVDAAEKLFGAVPPWGILTGVRPAKIGAQMRERGLSFDAIKRELMSEYLVSEPKSELICRLLQNRETHVTEPPQNSCSLYVSVPFCPTRCAYCSFVSYSNDRLMSLIPEYTKRLCEDVRRGAALAKERGYRINTVYIGGGTPTVLDEERLKKLLCAINESVDVPSLEEFTVEAGRPDTVTREKMRIMAELGVTRTAVNPQTLSDDVLRKIGRNHSSEDFLRAADIALSSGIRTVNCDLIAGLPHDSFDGFKASLDRVISLDPQNITVHTFCAKRAADLVTKSTENTRDMIYSFDGGDTGRCVDYSQSALYAAGYEPYYMYRQKNAAGNLENVGFAKPGHEGLYNIYIMEELQTIIAVGAGAVTKIVGEKRDDKITRIFMPKYPFEYLERDCFSDIENASFEAPRHMI